MKHFIIVILAFLASYTFAQEENTATPPRAHYGTIYASHEDASRSAYAVSDQAGNGYVSTFEGEIKIFNRDGKLTKTIKIAGMPPGVHTPFVILKNGDLFVVKRDGKSIHTLDLLDSSGVSKRTFGQFITNGNMRPFLLKNGNVAMVVNKLLYVYTPELKEVLKFEAKEDLYPNIYETPDGTLVFQGGSVIYFVTADKKVTEVVFGQDSNPFSIDLVTKAGIVTATKNDNQVKHFDSKGKELLAYTDDSKCNGSSELPDGTIICTSKVDGYVYFKNSQGKVINKHLHESQVASHPAYLGKNTIAYANTSELVFVDLQGKETGFQPYDRHNNYDVTFVDLGQNQFMVIQGLMKKIIFFRH
ncbi:MAG TPA: hypothetical protein VNJ08_17720 [Bacteriovoracaceae bacterium]|nr:hypothetical protein [Bacteriovoracaceae bacterium]